MCFSKVPTLTSEILSVVNGDSFFDENNQNHGFSCNGNILVFNKNIETVNNDKLIERIKDMGFRVILSSNIPSVFSTKAINRGILAIEISSSFLENIIRENQRNKTKLFIDLKGQEIMIINSGQKEYFELSEYYKEIYEPAKYHIDDLYLVWDDIKKISNNDEVIDYINI